MLGQKEHLLPQGTGSKRSPSCKMPHTRLNVEPPNTRSVVFLQLGLSFSVRTVLNLSYSESNLEPLLWISDEEEKQLLTIVWVEKVHEVLFFHLWNRGNGYLTSFCRWKKGRAEGVAQEGVGFGESQKCSPKLNVWEEVRFGKRKWVSSWGGSAERENHKDAAVWLSDIHRSAAEAELRWEKWLLGLGEVSEVLSQWS